MIWKYDIFLNSGQYSYQECGFPWPPEKFINEGSNGLPLNGEPSASHADFIASSCFYSSVVGRPICFLCCSYMIFLIAPWVSSSNSCRGLVLFTFDVSIYGSPRKTVDHIFYSAFSRFKVIKFLPLIFSIFQTDSPAFILSCKSPSIMSSPVFLRMEILLLFSFTSSYMLWSLPFWP